nr:MAG TPA: hypothetical protein [Caudoviricetes sp.]
MKMRWIVIQETQSYNYSEKLAYYWYIFFVFKYIKCLRLYKI